ncbi:helix-turn-helix transcriptional regulator [Phaeodactylibacter xiamenensis]|uniref:helix-turn-helix transcriptional regulator n=1 Tax=Phaeodactylibacter xiamenensis TaxID=1524460 RepID=UPI003BAB9345
MGRDRKMEPDNGALTTPMNADNKEFKELQLFLKNKADELDEKQRLQIELFALQIKIEDYLDAHEDEDHITEVGEFLRLYIDKLGLKQNELARYIGLDPTNFNKILSGKRKVNFELSFMLSQIFNLDPKTWILIQVKNEYLELKRDKLKHFKKYKLEDLINT